MQGIGCEPCPPGVGAVAIVNRIAGRYPITRSGAERIVAGWNHVQDPDR